MSERQNLTDVPAREQPDQVNGQEQGDKDQLTNEMHHDKPTPSKTVNHIYNYPMVHQLCGHLLEWTIPRWGYLLTETYTQKVVKPIVDVGLKFPGANIVTRVADSIDGYSNSLLDTVDIMFPITTKSAQHNWEDAKSAAEHVREAFRSDLQKMGDTMPNRAKAVLTTTIRCGSSVVVTFSIPLSKYPLRPTSSSRKEPTNLGATASMLLTLLGRGVNSFMMVQRGDLTRLQTALKPWPTRPSKRFKPQLRTSGIILRTSGTRLRTSRTGLMASLGVWNRATVRRLLTERDAPTLR